MFDVLELVEVTTVEVLGGTTVVLEETTAVEVVDELDAGAVELVTTVGEDDVVTVVAVVVVETEVVVLDIGATTSRARS